MATEIQNTVSIWTLILDDYQSMPVSYNQHLANYHTAEQSIDALSSRFSNWVLMDQGYLIQGDSWSWWKRLTSRQPHTVRQNHVGVKVVKSQKSCLVIRIARCFFFFFLKCTVNPNILWIRPFLQIRFFRQTTSDKRTWMEYPYNRIQVKNSQALKEYIKRFSSQVVNESNLLS